MAERDETVCPGCGHASHIGWCDECGCLDDRQRSLHDGSTRTRVTMQSDAEFNQRVREVAAETDSPVGSLWWLSFCDGSLPTGSQFLGACLVEAENLPAAVTRSHLLGINPGGEVKIAGPITPESVPPGYPLDRLLSKAEIAALDEQGGEVTDVE